MQQLQRPRRNRKNSAIRDLVAETELNMRRIIYPVFVCEGHEINTPIKTLPGQSRLSPDLLSEKIKIWKKSGLLHYALFPQIPDEKKDKVGTEALNDAGLLPETIKRLKDDHPEICIYSDVALDPYSSDGHDGIVKNGEILNDPSVEILAHMAVKQAEWGSDWVAPSDMMDGRIGKIRKELDRAGYQNVNILAYTAKYASSFYGPFRDALESAPKFGDKKTYQIDFRNSREAVREANMDIAEGADMIMVKPALMYLDIIKRLSELSDVPVAAFNVSGEYAMIKFAAQNGALDENRAIVESLTAIKRAGADAILTYFAPQLSGLLHD
jgi:porphobilinogen synthase